MLACLSLALLHLHPPRIQNISARDSLVFFFSTNCSALNQKKIYIYSTTQSSDIGISLTFPFKNQFSILQMIRGWNMYMSYCANHFWQIVAWKTEFCFLKATSTNCNHVNTNYYWTEDKRFNIYLCSAISVLHTFSRIVESNQELRFFCESINVVHQLSEPLTEESDHPTKVFSFRLFS